MNHLIAFANAIRPRENITVTEWADTYRILSSKNASEPGKWRTSRAPYTQEIMDRLSTHDDCQRVVMMFAAQLSKTEVGLNWLGYIMHHVAESVLVYLPSIDFMDDWIKQKLNPMMNETPVIAKIFDRKRTQEASNSGSFKDYPGGSMMINTVNSTSSTAGKSAGYVLCDEVDRYPAEVGKEGDPLGLIDARTTTFRFKRKVLLISTPTIKGASAIEGEYIKSDQRRYYVPCPHCKEKQTLKWKNLSWSKNESGQVEKAWYNCEHCGEQFDESFKTTMLANGEWRAANPKSKVRGYALSGLYAPIGLGFTWDEIAQKWLDSLDNQKKLKQFINTTLGESWEDQTTKFDAHEFLKRLEDVQQRTIPKGCLALTAGVDTQDNWLAVTLLGWGEGKLWIIEWHTIEGDTTRDEVWDKLEQYLNTPLINTYGYQMRIDAAGIDTRGHRGEQVKNFVARLSLKVPVFGVQGSTTRMGKSISTTPSYPERTRKGKYLKGSYALWNIGTEHCKDYIFGALASDEELPSSDRTLHFPIGLDEDYFNGLLSETFDPEKNRYIQKTGAKHKRNEPLDTLVYAWAIGHHKEIRIGMTMRGDPSPQYWVRREAMLEFTFMGGVEHFEPDQNVEQPIPVSTARGKISLENWNRK